MQNPLDTLKAWFFRSKQQPQQTDPELVAAFQQAQSQVSPRSNLSEQERYQWFRMGYTACAESSKNLRTARYITYNLCPSCMANRSVSLQNDQQPFNPYRLQLDPTSQQNVPQTPMHAQLEAKKEESRQWGTAIRMNLSNPSTAGILPAISPKLAHEIQQMNAPVDISQVPTGDITPKNPHDFIVVEDKCLNSQPVTPDKMPVVNMDEGETVTGIHALPAYFKHTSRRG